MVSEKTEIELEKHHALKAVRSFVRLKHSMLADEELNRLLPLVEEKFDAAVAAGTLPQIHVDLKELLGGLE